MHIFPLSGLKQGMRNGRRSGQSRHSRWEKQWGERESEREEKWWSVRRSGVKENRVCKDGRATLEWKSAENHPRIIQHIKRSALKFWSQHFHSLDLQLYCWVAEQDESALYAYSALSTGSLSSCTTGGCHWYPCSLKACTLSECSGAELSHRGHVVLLKVCNWHKQCENLLPPWLSLPVWDGVKNAHRRAAT